MLTELRAAIRGGRLNPRVAEQANQLLKWFDELSPKIERIDEHLEWIVNTMKSESHGGPEDTDDQRQANRAPHSAGRVADAKSGKTNRTNRPRDGAKTGHGQGDSAA